MEQQKMVEMFESIPQFETYSNYSHTLSRVFKNNSLKNLIDILKNPKKFHGGYFLDEISKKENDNEKVSSVNIMKNFYSNNSNSNSPVKNTHKKTKSTINNNKIEIKRSFLANCMNDVPDVNKYNPNYNAIYKNVHTFKILPPVNHNLKNNKNKKKNLIMIRNNSANKIVSKNNDEKIYINHMTEGNNKKKRKKIILPPIKNINNNVKEIDKNNHALKFDNYTKRVFSVKQTNDKVSYLEPYNYLKNLDKSIDFKKIPSRKENSLINSSLLETPNFCYYHPNYDIIYKSPIKFSFKYDEKKKHNKKFMMKKLLSSFKCEPGYHIIDVKKLDENNKDDKLRERLLQN